MSKNFTMHPALSSKCLSSKFMNAFAVRVLHTMRTSNLACFFCDLRTVCCVLAPDDLLSLVSDGALVIA